MIKNGGPAFPTYSPEAKSSSGKTIRPRDEQAGMSLRDYFASQAITALMSDQRWVNGLDDSAKKEGLLFRPALATCAYQLADAMLAERDKAQT